jgi:hypothetical protein
MLSTCRRIGSASAVNPVAWSGAFLHQLDQLRQPGHCRQPHVQHTFAGIAPSSVPAFVVAEVIGGIVAIVVIKDLYPDLTRDEAADIMVPHHGPGMTSEVPPAGASFPSPVAVRD